MFCRFAVLSFIFFVIVSPAKISQYREYLEECVSSYKSVISQVCPSSIDPTMPCLSDAVMKQYNNDTAMALIRLGFQCCDTACNQKEIIKSSCCDDMSCYRRCKGKPPQEVPIAQGKAEAFRRLRLTNREAAMAFAHAELFNSSL